MPSSAVNFSTSLSLVRRVRALDPAAWDLFLRLYGPLIYGWARRLGFQNQDAADLTQNVFVAVWRGIPKFTMDRPDASFRGWLRAITQNLFYAQARRHDVEADNGVDLDRMIDPVSDATVTVGREADLFQTLTQRALELVRETVDESTWRAFWDVTIEDEPVSEVAEVLGMTPAAVRQAKYRVLCRLRELLADR